MAEIQDLDPTDANNTGRWPENMPFNGVNNAGRADEGILARWYRDTDGSRVASGAANAFTVTSTRTISVLVDNIVMAFTANHTITGPATLNLNGLGAKSIRRFNNLNLAAGDIVSGQPLIVIYKLAADVWFMVSAAAALTGNMFVDLSEGVPANPIADTARVYAEDEGGVTNLLYRDSGGAVTGLRNATQAEMESGSSGRRTVTPVWQPFHPLHPKASGRANSAGGAISTVGIASITHPGTGVYQITLSSPMSNTSYRVQATCEGAGGSVRSASYIINSTTQFQILTARPGAGGGSQSDDFGFCFDVFGDRP